MSINWFIKNFRMIIDFIDIRFLSVQYSYNMQSVTVVMTIVYNNEVSPTYI